MKMNISSSEYGSNSTSDSNSGERSIPSTFEDVAGPSQFHSSWSYNPRPDGSDFDPAKSYPRVAVVTGANRGLGYEVVRGLCKEFNKGDVIYLTSKNTGEGMQALSRLQKEGCYPIHHHLNVTDIYEAQAFANELYHRHKGLDILVHSAGVRFDETRGTTYDVAYETMTVNFYFVMHVTMMMYHAFRPHARVVNIASSTSTLSGFSSDYLREKFADPKLDTRAVFILMKKYLDDLAVGNHLNEGWPKTAFQLSKIAVVKITQIMQEEFDGKDCLTPDVIVNCVYPGDLKTRTNNYTGTMTAEEGAKAVMKLALLPPDTRSPRGNFVWHDMRLVNWQGDNSLYSVEAR